ncbi:hypothetical protein [Sporosarcina cyprini]|uniref:hypothetical protein n=1 Tax=Sporosarcina cyprini TaxID=2910523 RepID=UPI001EDE65D7|nr:hypothetical protein [Sporosarcina cyprini]MCG3089155.1 hypothetical protein [Sporosarcina cyprini]
MEVIVKDQLQKFWLATEEGWIDAIGHSIHIDDIHLCVVAYDNKINVSEVTTGMRVAEKELSFTDLLNLQEKEDVMAYYNKIGRQISQLFSGKLPAIKQRIDERRKVTHTRLGTQPPIEDVDME